MGWLRAALKYEAGRKLNVSEEHVVSIFRVEE
jgi:hypothetical protein